MQIISLARTFAVAVAMIGFLGSLAKADNFLFSFTNNNGIPAAQCRVKLWDP
jgi:hypothetical protein